jgi:DNA topoisomerase-3
METFKTNANFHQESVRGIQWVKNYKFDFRFPQWGECSVTFTCVAGHIVAQDFPERFRKWHSCQPVDLFEAPIQSSIAEVRAAIYVNRLLSLTRILGQEASS